MQIAISGLAWSTVPPYGAGSTRNLVTATSLYQQQQPHGSTASCPSVHPSVPMSSRKCRPTQQEDENNFRDQQLPRKFRTTRQNGVFFRTKGQSYNASRSGGLCVPARSINNQITVAIVATPSDSIIFLPVLSVPISTFPSPFCDLLSFIPCLTDHKLYAIVTQPALTTSVVIFSRTELCNNGDTTHRKRQES